MSDPIEQVEPDVDSLRSGALQRLGVLHSLGDGALDHVVSLAARLFDTPMALVTLVGEGRQWWVSSVGLEKQVYASQDVSFCDHTIRQQGVTVVEDATLDPRFRDISVVTGAPGIRFYAGTPLVTSEGYAVGALCVLDVLPRTVTASQEAMLSELGAQIITQWELTAAATVTGVEPSALSASDGRRLQPLEDLIFEGAVGFMETSLDGVILSVNTAAARMLGYEAGDLIGTSALDLVHPDHRTDVDGAITDLVPGRHPPYGATRIYRHSTGRKVFVRCSVSRTPALGERPPRVTALLEDLTGRFAADTSRLVAERAREAILATATDAFISSDHAGAVVDWNTAAERLFGFTAAEAVGRQLWTLIVPDLSVDRHRRGLAQAAAGAPSSLIGVPTELTALHKDGSEIAVELTLWSTPTGDGTLHFHAFLRDIRERKASRERLELVLQGSGLGMWDRDMRTGSGVCDERWAGILGYSLAELTPVTADTWIDLTHPDDRDRVRRATEDHTAGLSPFFDVESRMRHRDGRWVWVRDRGQIVERSSDGRAVRMTGTLEDSTEKVQARQALERSGEALRATQRMARLGSWNYDLATDHVTWSDELFELFGLHPAQRAPDFADQSRLFEAKSWEELSAAVAETTRTGVPYELELQHVRIDSRDGWLHVRGEVRRDERGVIVGLVGYVLDISERKAAEQALASSESLFRTAMLSSPIGMAVSELDGSFRVVNGSLCRMLGRDEAWLTAHGIQDVVHPDDLKRIIRERAAVFEGQPVADGGPLRMVTSNSEVLWVKRAAELISGAEGGQDYLLVQYVDTTAEHDALEKLAYRAFHDQLTGLRNRAWILDMLDVDLRTAARVGGLVAVLFIDLDNFKIVNDSLGHAAGDEVLMTVASRISTVLRPGDRVGRAGGDEFVVVLPDVRDSRHAEIVAERIVSSVGTELTIRSHRIVPTVSIGIALNEPDSTSASLLRDSDAALFRAKAAGRSRWQFFDGAMHAHALARLTIEDEVRQGLSAAEFVVHYQPIVTLADRRVAGHEALVRWQHPTRGLVSPIDFLPTAEDSGLIVGIGQQVLDQVCALLASRRDLPGPISVNFSAVQLARAGWLQALTDTLDRHGVDPHRIVVELTETAVMSLLAGTRADLVALRDRGVAIHVDDFGTGFSSLSLLRDLPVTGLKLDSSFVADLSEGAEAPNALSTGLAGLANGLHLTGIAEGVETEVQHRILLEQGWTHAQGYLYARPSSDPALTIPTRGA